MATRLILPAAYSWQPQTIPTIASSALTVGLQEAVLPINGRMIRVPKNSQPLPPLTDTNSPTWAYSKYGSGKLFDGVNQVCTSAAGEIPRELVGGSAELWDEVTIAGIFMPTNTAATLKCAVRWGAGYTTNRIMLGSRAGANSIGMRVWDNAGGGQNIETTHAFWANNTPCVVMGTRSTSRSFSRLYLNGTQVIDTTHTAAGAVNNASGALCIGGHSSANDLWAGSVYLACIWLRAFSPAEAVAFGTNPWQIFDYTPRHLFVGEVAAAAFMARQGLNIQQAVNRASTY